MSSSPFPTHHPLWMKLLLIVRNNLILPLVSAARVPLEATSYAGTMLLQSQDTVQSEQRSLEKRGLIFPTGSFAKGTQELTVLLAAQQMCLFAKQSATYKGRRLLSAPRADPGGRC